MNTSAGTVSASPNLPVDGSRDEHRHLDCIYEKQICLFNFLTVLSKMHFKCQARVSR